MTTQNNAYGGAASTNRYRICDSVGRPISPDFLAPNYGAAQTVSHIYCSSWNRADCQLVVVNQGIPFQGPTAIGIATSGGLTACPSGVTY